MKELSDMEVLHMFNNAHPKLLFAPTPDHRCSRGCMMWKCPLGRTPVEKVLYGRCPIYVCKNHKVVHRCGENCVESERNVEGNVCVLTGTMVGERYTHHVSLKTDYWGRRVSGTHTFNSSSSSRSRSTGVNGKLLIWTRQSLQTLFSSPKRRDAYKSKISKLRSSLKTHNKPGVPFTTVNAMILQFLRRNNVSFNPPSPPNDPILEQLALSISTYSQKFPKVKRTQKTIFAFTSACVERLRTGMTIRGVQIFPMVPFVSTHAPEELQHGQLGNMKCRYMSAANLIIAQGVTSAAGIPLKNMAFILLGVSDDITPQ